MKIIGTRKEIETVLSALPGADMFDSNLIPMDGWRAEYQWVPIELIVEDRCETCKWHQHEDIDDGYVCVNSRSVYCCDWTENDYWCSQWEEK